MACKILTQINKSSQIGRNLKIWNLKLWFSCNLLKSWLGRGLTFESICRWSRLLVKRPIIKWNIFETKKFKIIILFYISFSLYYVNWIQYQWWSKVIKIKPFILCLFLTEYLHKLTFTIWLYLYGISFEIANHFLFL